MSKLIRLLFPLLCTPVLLLSCSGGSNAGGEEPKGWDKIVRTLSTVPSDALCVSYYQDCRDGMESLDSNSAFAGLGIERLRSPMVLSKSYNGSRVEVLCIAPVRSGELADTASALNMTLAAAKSRLNVEFIADAPSLEDGEGVLVLSPSLPQMGVALRHIREGRSILDVEGFRDAAMAARGARQMTIVRNSGVRRLLDQDFLGGMYSIRSSSAFIGSAALWTTVFPHPGGGNEIVCTSSGSGLSYSSMLESLPCRRSHLGSVLPQGTVFALSLGIGPEFRKAYEDFLDAEVRLTSYHRALTALEKQYGKSPLDWEKELDVTELAMVSDGIRKVVFIRPAKKKADSPCTDNPYPGYVPALYGSAFRIEDDSTLACREGWLLIGAKEDVEGMLQDMVQGEEEQQAELEWQNKDCRFVIYSSGEYISWDKNGIKTWKSNQ